MISEHSMALDTVRQVVHQLNESIVEKKEEVEDTIEAQIQRHLLELRSLRGMMRNFTSLLRDVLTDKLNQVRELWGVISCIFYLILENCNQDLSAATIQTRQNSVIQSISKNSEMIGSIMLREARFESRLQQAKQSTDHQENQLGNALKLLSRYLLFCSYLLRRNLKF